MDHGQPRYQILKKKKRKKEKEIDVRISVGIAAARAFAVFVSSLMMNLRRKNRYGRRHDELQNYKIVRYVNCELTIIEMTLEERSA